MHFFKRPHKDKSISNPAAFSGTQTAQVVFLRFAKNHHQ